MVVMVLLVLILHLVLEHPLVVEEVVVQLKTNHQQVLVEMVAVVVDHINLLLMQLLEKDSLVVEEVVEVMDIMVKKVDQDV